MFAGGFPTLKKTGKDGAASMVGQNPAPKKAASSPAVAAPPAVAPPLGAAKKTPSGVPGKSAPPPAPVGVKAAGPPPPTAAAPAKAAPPVKQFAPPVAATAVKAGPMPGKGAAPSPNALHKSAPSAPAAAAVAPQTSPRKAPAGEVCLVIYDYTAGKNGELSIKKNDTVLVLEKKPSGWWKGQGLSGSCEGQSGLLPGNYCQVLERVRAKYAYKAAKSDELTFAKGDVISVRKKGQNWWIGDLNGQIGAFPISYVVDLETGRDMQPPAK